MAPPTPANIEAQVLQRIEERLLDRKSVYDAAMKDVSVAVAKLGIKGFTTATDLAEAIFETGREQAQQYETDIVGVYGDISTQQEKYGKSAAKLAHERTLEFRQDFLQMEEGGVKLVDVYQDGAKAAAHAAAIIGSLQGSAAQFTDDLQKQNLTVIQLLSKASGLSEEQSASFVKLAKGRREDVKQMLADVGTISKTLADKFSLDTKRVAQNVVEITKNTSTFGKVSIEAAAAAAAKFESLGVSIEDVTDSIGSSFGSFSGAADAAAKMSQVFGVNIDAMQMMVDVNSGPEGMVNAIDSLRESFIGAGIDASELSAPMRRLIKDMTGVRDDATIESLFDPDRISADTDDILDSAAKAAEAQKAPGDAIKFLSQDIEKVQRGLGDVDKLVKTHLLARLGTDAVEAAKGMSALSTASAQFFDGSNRLIEKGTPLGPAVKTALKGAVAGSQVATVAMEGTRQLVYNEGAALGVDIARGAPPNYAAMQREGKGAWQDAEYQKNTGYVPPAQAINEAALTKSLYDLQALTLQSMKEEKAQGSVSAETQAKITAAQAATVSAYSAIGFDIQKLVNTVYGTPASSGAITPSLASIVTGTSTRPPAQATSAAPVADASAPPAVTSPAAVPVSPVAAPPVITPAATPATSSSPAPASPTSSTAAQVGGQQASVSAPVVASSQGASTNIGTATATSAASNPPIVINLDVSLGVDEVKKVLVQRGVATVGR